MIPGWLLDIPAGLMLVVAAVSAARLVAAWRWPGRSGAAPAYVDVAHLLMAIAMAGMLAARLQTLPDGAWEVIFALMTVFFACRVVRDARVSGLRTLTGGHCAPHLIHAASMLYMFLALTGPVTGGAGGMAGMASSGAGSAGTLEFPALAFVFALLLAGYTVWDLDQLSGPGVSKHYRQAPARMAPVAVLAGVAPGGAAGLPADTRSASTGTGPAHSGPDPVRSGGGPGGGGPGDGRSRGLLAPWVAVSCRVAMGVTMAFMLVIMI